MEVDISRLKRHPKTVDEMSAVASLVKSGKYDTEAAIGHLMLSYEKESAELKLRPNLPVKPKKVKRDMIYYANYNNTCRKILRFLQSVEQRVTANEVSMNVQHTTAECSNWLRIMAEDCVISRDNDIRRNNGHKSWVYYI